MNPDLGPQTQKQAHTIPWGRIGWTLAVVWTLVVAASLVWNFLQEKDEVLCIARHVAQTIYERDILYRRWASAHGGVYVPVSPQSPPTPYLAHLPERDLRTPSGRLLTLLNPAYMTRQVYAYASKAGQVRGHLTSLRPLRPGNAPDPWEERALQAFEEGKTEVHTVTAIDGRPYMRLMRPFRTEKSCLRCHAQQGYKVGDIRGGVSIALPMGPIWAEHSIYPMFIGHLGLWLLGLGGIFIGTRQLSRSTAEKIRAQEAANQELESFSYSVSHDLRAPLRAIQGFSHMVLMDHGEALDAEGRRCLNIIIANTKKMAQLIDDLLAFSRLGRQVLKVEAVDMEAMVKRVIEELRGSEAERKVEWNLGTLPQALADKSLMYQVWVNLLGNALKFTGPKETAVIEVGCMQDGDQDVFYVKDNGVGFEMNYAAKLFGVFERLHNSEEFAGTGVGLALVKRIIDRHGGRIWAAGEVDTGATFYFALPRA
jgi:signal transduction histidine kinase